MPNTYGFSAKKCGDIVALGELLIDFVPAKPNMRLREAGEVIKTVSGSAGIFACAAAAFAGRSGFLGQLGKDALSEMAYDVIRSQGVDLSHTASSDKGQIGLAFLEYLPNGRNYQYYRENSVGSQYTAQQIDTDYLKEAFSLHYTGMLLELSPAMREACQAAARIARENGVLVSFDPNIRKELISSPAAKDNLLNAVAGADIISPTLEEAQYLTGKTALGEVLCALCAMGPKVVAITRDKDGAVLCNGGQVVLAGGTPVEAIDPTGAGDTFAAALVYCVMQDMPLDETALFCNCAGTLTATKRGAIGMALPSLQEVQRYAATRPCTLARLPLAEL